ncbi:MAG: glutamate--tRNA ligase [Bacteroidia bacterium]|nr:glutamate--tRNA ligase [Bacteroidia bacterium]
MEQEVRVRFAPSPTGPLHIGGVRTALFNFLYCKKNNGKFILRIEDTDQDRFVPGAEDYIINALEWLGINFDFGPHLGGPDQPYRQSERKSLYAEYAKKLVDSNAAYYAFDTQEELDKIKQKYESEGLVFQYGPYSRNFLRNSLTLSSSETKRLLSSGLPYVIRFKIPIKEEVRFYDDIRGWVVVHSSQLDDKVLLKSDGMPTYHLANVVDDYLMRITKVIRGEEWLPSTPLHILIYKAFGWESKMPSFAHLPLILKPDGKGKLSKRDGDVFGFPVFPIEWNDHLSGEIYPGYKESGYLPEAILNFLALLGWNPGTEQELFSLAELIEHFSLEKIHKAGARFDFHKVEWFNQQYLKQKKSTDILPVVFDSFRKSYGEDLSEEKMLKIIDLYKERVTTLNDFISVSAVLFTEFEIDQKVVQKRWNNEARMLAEKLMNRLNSISTWSVQAIDEAFKLACQDLGLQPSKQLATFRLLITGSASGPSLMEMAEIIGKDRVLDRIKICLQTLPTFSPA